MDRVTIVFQSSTLEAYVNLKIKHIIHKKVLCTDRGVSVVFMSGKIGVPWENLPLRSGDHIPYFRDAGNLNPGQIGEVLGPYSQGI